MTCCATCGHPVAEYGGIAVDKERFTVIANGKSVRLSPLEFETFELLLKKRGKYVSGGAILDQLYQLRSDGDVPEAPSLLNVMIHHVRKKLRCVNLVIENSRNVGFALKVA